MLCKVLGQPGAQRHSRVLRVVVKCQPVQNYYNILTITMAFSETTGVPGMEGHQVRRTQDFSLFICSMVGAISSHPPLPRSSPGGVFHFLDGTPGRDFTGLQPLFIYYTPSGLDPWWGVGVGLRGQRSTGVKTVGAS